jgi:ABC-type Fe3+/spermidine/putrescine transport system ATPase subunit
LLDRKLGWWVRLGLEVQSVSKAWQGFELNGIEMNVEDGDYFVILGPTGAGKTLLLETIMGFHLPDTGRILLDGSDVTDVPVEQRMIGYVSQKCVLFPHMTVRQNVEFGLKMRKTPKTKRVESVDRILDFMNLKALEHRYPEKLSGGEKQKVALARVLALEPKTILFDEPLTGIDAKAAREIKNELKRIHGLGKTIIHVTHNQIEGFSLANKMAIIKNGSVVQTGKPKDIFTKPESEFVAKFLGYENVFSAKLLKTGDSFSLVKVADVELNAAEKVTTPECTIAIRPEDISILFSAPKTDSVNVLEGKIVEFADQGSTVAIIVDAALPFTVVVNRRFFMENNLEIGQAVWLSFESDSVKII